MNLENKGIARKSLPGICAGLSVYLIIGLLSLYLLKFTWEDYALAAIDKSYSLPMKLARLLVGVYSAFSAGSIATIIAKDRGKTALTTGLIILIAGGYNHLFNVWNDYPAWYHLGYLIPIVPLTLFGHFVAHKLISNHIENSHHSPT